jgi:predicted component of type VI protein secretion system
MGLRVRTVRNTIDAAVPCLLDEKRVTFFAIGSLSWTLSWREWVAKVEEDGSLWV